MFACRRPSCICLHELCDSYEHQGGAVAIPLLRGLLFPFPEETLPVGLGFIKGQHEECVEQDQAETRQDIHEDQAEPVEQIYVVFSPDILHGDALVLHPARPRPGNLVREVAQLEDPR